MQLILILSITVAHKIDDEMCASVIVLRLISWSNCIPGLQWVCCLLLHKISMLLIYLFLVDFFSHGLLGWF